MSSENGSVKIQRQIRDCEQNVIRTVSFFWNDVRHNFTGQDGSFFCEKGLKNVCFLPEAIPDDGENDLILGCEDCQFHKKD